MLYTIKWPLLYAITHPLGGPIDARDHMQLLERPAPKSPMDVGHIMFPVSAKFVHRDILRE